VRKRVFCVLLILPLLAGLVPAFAETTDIKGVLTRDLTLKASYPDNPVIDGVSSTTGLPFEGTYVPILQVFDNSMEARPQWGIAEADVVYQVPNAGVGATKLLALYADTIPASSGGTRSARVPFVDIRESWDAAFVHAGMPPKTVSDIVRVDLLLKKYGVKAKGLDFNLIENAQEFGVRETFAPGPHNLSARLLDIKNVLIQSGYQFKQRPFLFTDQLPSAGDIAWNIEISHYGDKTEKSIGNPSSWSSFTYDPVTNAYLRAVKEGPYYDRNNPAVQLSFSNVIVLRTKFSYADGDYVILKNFTGSGAADIFMGGRYIKGAWYRERAGARIVLLDGKGSELPLQRGKTFIIVTNAVTKVSYGNGK
jgi:hypothetical protein